MFFLFSFSKITKIKSTKTKPIRFKNIPIKFLCSHSLVNLSSVLSREIYFGSNPKTFGFGIIFVLSKRNFKLVLSSRIRIRRLRFPFAVDSFFNSVVKSEVLNQKEVYKAKLKVYTVICDVQIIQRLI